MDNKNKLSLAEILREFDRLKAEQGHEAAYDYLANMAYKNTEAAIYVLDLLLPDAGDRT